jgi:heme a synthase
MSSTTVPESGTAVRTITRISWGVLFYNIFVILWGAFVRATGSGAGCGDHWPLCNGEVIPVLPQMHTMIEFTHRLTSGLALLSAILLYVAARRQFSPVHMARRAAFWALVLMLNETLIGAILVLLRLVAESRSPWRGVVLSIHLVNTMLLLAALTLTAWWSGFERPVWRPSPDARRWIRIAVASMLLTTAAGGIAALGDTLFPAESLRQGIEQEFGKTAPMLVRLRVLHPLVAVVTGGFLFWLASQFSRIPMANAILGLTLSQFALGGLNIVLLTPVWTQLLHLLLTDLLWVSLIIFLAALAASGNNRESANVYS